MPKIQKNIVDKKANLIHIDPPIRFRPRNPIDLGRSSFDPQKRTLLFFLIHVEQERILQNQKGIMALQQLFCLESFIPTEDSLAILSRTLDG